jgi:DNA-binding LytR/AlgR family response regulator
MTNTSPAILTVEDAFLVGLQLKRDIESLGFEVLGPVSSVAQAFDLLDHPRLVFAVLDINLGSEDSMPVAEELDTRGIPYLFITGYDSVAAEQFKDVTVLRKPTTPAQITEAITSMIPLPAQPR